MIIIVNYHYGGDFMKRNYLFIITLLLALSLVGCKKAPNKLEDESLSFEEEEVEFDIEQITFSKSFQFTEPNVELITKNNKLKLMAYLGLSEHTGVNINKIIKKGNEVGVHVSGTTNVRNKRLAIPQVFIELNKADFPDIENLKFSIIYDDYQALKIKFSINDMVNKLESSLNIISKKLHSFNLIKQDNDLLWEVSYKGIFDKGSADLSIINLYALIDANTGEIIESNKDKVSTSIDFGYILDFKDSKILYKKSCSSSNDDQLWVYSTDDSSKQMIFSTDNKIQSSSFNEDCSYISLIESNDLSTNFYIISLSDNRAFKPLYEGSFNPNLSRWKDKDNIYLVDNVDNVSIVFSYNIKDNELVFLEKLHKIITNLIIQDDLYLVTEKTDDDFNRKISLTKNWSYFDPINTGFNTNLVDKNTLAYLYNDEKTNSNTLIIYDFNESEFLEVIENNISYLNTIDNKHLLYSNKNATSDDYSIYKYSLKERESQLLGTLLGDRVYYIDENTLYLNMSIPLDDAKAEIIYSIDLEKLNTISN